MLCDSKILGTQLTLIEYFEGALSGFHSGCATVLLGIVEIQASLACSVSPGHWQNNKRFSEDFMHINIIYHWKCVLLNSAYFQ